jgi:hypothetical protein
MAGLHRRAAELSAPESAIVGANIRALRQRRGWTQSKLGELMGWQTPSTVCAAEGRRGGRQRAFTPDEVRRLGLIFGLPSWKLTTVCAQCDGNPPPGFACLACGASRATAGNLHARRDECP